MRISRGRMYAGATAVAGTLWIAGASLPLHAHGTEARRVELLSWSRDRIVRVDLARVWSNLFSANPDAEILFRARLPRVLLGVAIGGGMAACGVVLQALLGNPLACPQMLGVSGGASLGGILGLPVSRTYSASASEGCA